MNLSKPVEPVTVEIGGRSYTVEHNAVRDCYWLFGPRGAKYKTHRIRAAGTGEFTDRMFLVGYTNPQKPRPDPLGPILLSDRNGTLTVI